MGSYLPAVRSFSLVDLEFPPILAPKQFGDPPFFQPSRGQYPGPDGWCTCGRGGGRDATVRPTKLRRQQELLCLQVYQPGGEARLEPGRRGPSGAHGFAPPPGPRPAFCSSDAPRPNAAHGHAPPPVPPPRPACSRSPAPPSPRAQLYQRSAPPSPRPAPGSAFAVAMTAAVFFGCAFIAFGPALALYVFTIATEPLRIILLIIGAFFWLVSLLLSSLVWFMATTITDNKDERVQKYLLIFGVLVSVLIQETFRFAYYKLLKKASEGLKSLNPDETAPSMRLLAYVSGLGFGIMSGVFSFVNTLSDSLGPGTVGIHGDPPQFFLNSDLHKSSLWIQSGVVIHHHGAHGHLGLLCFWRQLPEPEALPALPRQGLPPLQPALQITSENQRFSNSSPRLIVFICPLNPWIFKEEKRMEPEISPDFKAGFSPQVL
uniref:Gamma-secretase subunit APH-1 n=1 Tax=Sus scrofa TaxID=9823 RepID=A0A8D0TXW9_PIG